MRHSQWDAWTKKLFVKSMVSYFCVNGSKVVVVLKSNLNLIAYVYSKIVFVYICFYIIIWWYVLIMKKPIKHSWKFDLIIDLVNLVYELNEMRINWKLNQLIKWVEFMLYIVEHVLFISWLDYVYSIHKCTWRRNHITQI